MQPLQLNKLVLFLFLLFFSYVTSNAQCGSFAPTVTLHQALCYGECSSLKANVAGGVTPFTYTLYRNGIVYAVNTTDSVVVCMPGIYYFHILDGNNCLTNTNFVTVTNPPSGLISNVVSLTKPIPPVCTGLCGEMELNTAGGIPPYKNIAYDILGNPIKSFDSATTVEICNAGLYYFYVEDSNGCSAFSDTISSNNPPYSTIIVNIGALSHGGYGVSCNNASNGTIVVNPYNGTPSISGYTYTWSLNAQGQTGAIVNGLSAGLYSVTATDSLGCTGDTSILLTSPPPFIVHINAPTNSTPICQNATTPITATADISAVFPITNYNWNAGAGTLDTFAANPGIITLIATDANGCTTTALDTIEGLPIVDEAIIDNALDPFGLGHCKNASSTLLNIITIQGSPLPGTFYGAGVRNGSQGPGQAVFYPDSAALDMGHTGDVELTYTYLDSYNCINNATFTTVVHEEPELYFMNLPNVICPDAAPMQLNIGCLLRTGNMGQNIVFNALQPQTGTFTNTELNGIATPFITLFDSLQPSVLANNSISGVLNPVRIRYIYTSDATYGNCTGVIEDTTYFDAFETTINYPYNSYHLFEGDTASIGTSSTDATNTIYNWSSSANLLCGNCSSLLANPIIDNVYYLNAVHTTTGCFVSDTIGVNVFTRPNKDTLYVELAPDSLINICTRIAPFISGNGNSTINYFSNLYGNLASTTFFNCFNYQSNNSIEGTDTVLWVNCEQLCDTTIIYISTLSCVWPGDANSDGIANNLDLLPIGLHYGQLGFQRTNASINYNCQPSRNWGIGTINNPSVDIKHIDTDGNEIIEDIDTNAIVFNWSQTHQKNNSNAGSSGVDIYIDTTTCMPGDTITLDVILGANLVPSNGYGIAFTINYDATAIDSGSVQILYNNSWLGTIGLDMIAIDKDFYSQGEIEVAITRIDHTNASGGGPICQIQLIIKDDVLPKSNFLRANFDIDNVYFIDSIGSPILTNSIPSEILITNIITPNHLVENKAQLTQIYPNPTNGYLKIKNSQEMIDVVEVFSITKELLYQKTGISSREELVNLTYLPTGVYLLKTTTASGFVQNYKVVKL